MRGAFARGDIQRGGLKIYEGAFSGCESLQSVRLVDLPSLESIEKDAFSGSAVLSSVDLCNMEALESIHDSAFGGYATLKCIRFVNLPQLEEKARVALSSVFLSLSF